jgi:hypothetical protein
MSGTRNDRPDQHRRVLAVLTYEQTIRLKPLRSEAAPCRSRVAWTARAVCGAASVAEDLAGGDRLAKRVDLDGRLGRRGLREIERDAEPLTRGSLDVGRDRSAASRSDQ